MTEMLNDSTVLDYLRARGLLSTAAARAVALGGGVSNIVLAVTQGDDRLVVKQSLPRLRVADEWLAPVERVITEGKAIELASTLLGSGPTLRDRDPTQFTITMDRAPDHWSDWKSKLLDRKVEVATAGRIGSLVGALHRETLDGAGLDEDFFATEPFKLLRRDPYYQATAERAPLYAARILELARELTTQRRCLVHGDLSPKNILVGPNASDDVWLIDWEVAHYGDPVFDLAFMLTHLTMKAIHVPECSEEFDAAAVAFAESYEQESGPRLTIEWDRVMRHTGCLLMARVLSKSPAEYLNEGERDSTLRLGGALLDEQHHGLPQLRSARDRILQ